MSEPVIRYLNLSGARVGVFESQARAGYPDLTYRAGCAGCLETYGSAERPQTLAEARDWAGEHSATCRALPQPPESGEPDYRTLAADAVERAAMVMRGDGTQTENRDRNASAGTYLAMADVYARLSGA